MCDDFNNSPESIEITIINMKEIIIWIYRITKTKLDPQKKQRNKSKILLLNLDFVSIISDIIIQYLISDQ